MKKKKKKGAFWHLVRNAEQGNPPVVAVKDASDLQNGDVKEKKDASEPKTD